MSFQYSSPSNGFLVVHRERLPHERLKSAESHEFNQNSVVEQGTRYANYHACPERICSPVTSSPGFSSHNSDGRRSTWSQSNEGSTVLYSGDRSEGKEPMEAASDGVGPSSSRSDNASIGVLAANLHSNRESKPTPEYLEEENDGVRDIHVTVEQLADATSNAMRRPARHRQHSWSDTSTFSFVSSDSESISLSREFDNVLTVARTNSNAVQTRTTSNAVQTFDSNSENSSVRTPAIRSSHLPGIGEEEPARNTREEAGRDRDEGDVNYGNSNIRESMAFVPSSSTVAEGNRGQISVGRDYFAVVPINRSLGRQGSTSDRDAPPSSWDTHDNERGALVDSGNRNGEYLHRESRASSTRSIEHRLSTPKKLALQKVKREELEAKAVAWEEAKMAKVDNRFKRDEAIIDAWENEKTVKANIKMKKVERKLEEKRATAFEKMQNEIAKDHRKAENRRAVAEARRGAAKAKILENSDNIRSLGRLPRKFLLF